MKLKVVNTSYIHINFLNQVDNQHNMYKFISTKIITTFKFFIIMVICCYTSLAAQMYSVFSRNSHHCQDVLDGLRGCWAQLSLPPSPDPCPAACFTACWPCSISSPKEREWLWTRRTGSSATSRPSWRYKLMLVDSHMMAPCLCFTALIDVKCDVHLIIFTFPDVLSFYNGD